MDWNSGRQSGWTQVRFGDPADVRISVAFHPYVSVFSLLCDGVSELNNGAARSPVAKAVQSVTGQARRAVAPIVAPGYSVGPDCLSPGDALRDTDLDEELERLRSLTTCELRHDLERNVGHTDWPDHWARIWDRPRQWIHEMASAIEEFGVALEPIWRASLDQRQRESERIGTAVVRGAGDVALATAHSRGTMREASILEFPDEEAVCIEAADRRIALTPMIGNPRSAPCNLDLPGVVWFGYPLPYFPQEVRQRISSPEELDVLLTPIRARLLRALDREHTMHAVADVVHCSAATATHHCDQLVKAGLLQRRREGKSMLVSRSARGDQLLALYSGTT